MDHEWLAQFLGLTDPTQVRALIDAFAAHQRSIRDHERSREPQP